MDGRLYLVPAGIVSGAAAAAALVGGQGWGLAGGQRAFTGCHVFWRGDGHILRSYAPFSELIDWSEREGTTVAAFVAARLHMMARPRPSFAGLSTARPLIMGVLNVTPDSFSDGGRHVDVSSALDHGLAMRAAGADLIDVGGESTRPGAQPLTADTEAARVLPVVQALAAQGIVVSIDTRHAAVMQAAVAAGASVINDVSALEGDPHALAVAAGSSAGIVLMHMQGDPRTMQVAPSYTYAPLDVYDYLEQRLAACLTAGIGRDRLCVDPGIGFGKSVAHNREILGLLGLYHGLEVPVLLGASRKSFVAALSKGEPATQRLPGSLAAALAGLDQGVQILRVHDVAETAQAVAVWQGLHLG